MQLQPVETATDRQQTDYKTALELELWKEVEQEKFVRELEEKSELRLKQITAEWKRKETGTLRLPLSILSVSQSFV